MIGQTKQIYQFGPFRLIPKERQLLRDGQTVPLQPKVFDLLLALVENSGHLVEKDELLRLVWRDSFVEEANLSVRMTILRRALGEDQNDFQYIETVPRRGYRFVAPVASLLHPSEKAATRLDRPPIRSMAVLPFLPLTRESRDEYLEFGMADTLITRLSSMKDLVVRPLSHVRKFDSLDRDPLAAGREQKVEAVLDASIQRLNDRVRVTARLLSIADGKPLWSHQCDQKCTDLFEVQDSISKEIAQALRTNLTGEEMGLLTRRGTESYEAWELYEKGKLSWNKMEKESIQKSIQYFQDAIDLDSNYALAYAGLANSYIVLGTFYEPLRQAAPKAKEMAEIALRIDDLLGEAHADLGRLKSIFYWNWADAEREFKQAIELSPNYAIGHAWYAQYLAAIGKANESIREIRVAESLDPQSLVISANVGWMLYLGRRYDEALEQCRKTLEMDPAFWVPLNVFGAASLKRAADKEAFEYWMKMKSIQGASPHQIVSFKEAYAKSGWKGVLLETIASSKRPKSKTEYPYIDHSDRDPGEMSLLYSSVGDRDQALKWLEKAHSRRDWKLMMLNVNPAYDNVRQEPRFRKLLYTLNLPPGVEMKPQSQVIDSPAKEE
jgi:DNA-binding winged helix-turn-helix (wHTH) protein/tetratricopeptide (TPR) repeat protein